MSWKPIFPEHAVERVRVVVTFSENVPGRLMSTLAEKFDQKRSDLGFGPQTQLATASFAIGVNQGALLPIQVPQGHAGWQFVREADTGLPVEAIVLNGNTLVYEMSEYSRWNLVLERFMDVCSEALLEIAGVVDAQSVVHDYFDRFVFSGAANAAQPSELLVDELTGSLPDEVKSGHQLWHLHRGWWDGDGEGRLLINQNYDALDAETPDSELVRSIQIYTKAEKRMVDKGLDLARISEHLNQMHSKCNDAVRWSLNATMRSMVGL